MTQSLTVSEAEREFPSLTEAVIRNAVYRGRVPATRLRGRILIDRADPVVRK